MSPDTTIIIKQFKMTLTNFYHFMNKLMSCLPIFYDEEFENNYAETDGDKLCIICLEKEESVVLRCEVNLGLKTAQVLLQMHQHLVARQKQSLSAMQKGNQH